MDSGHDAAYLLRALADLRSDRVILRAAGP